MPTPQTVTVCEVKHNSLAGDIEEMKAASIASENKRTTDLDKIYNKIDKWGDRLPTWGVMLMTAGGGLIGLLTSALGFVIKAKF